MPKFVGFIESNNNSLILQSVNLLLPQWRLLYIGAYDSYSLVVVHKFLGIHAIRKFKGKALN
jgi:hypothetical protein